MTLSDCQRVPVVVGVGATFDFEASTNSIEVLSMRVDYGADTGCINTPLQKQNAHLMIYIAL